MREVANSLCARPESFVVCCRGAPRASRVVRGAARCVGGETCALASRTPGSGEGLELRSSVADVCTAQGRCIATTTTTTPTSTTTSPPTTTTTIPCPPAAAGMLDLVVGTRSGSCGRVTSDVAGTTAIATLGCGTLVLGGGAAASPPEAPAPPGAVNRFGLGACVGDVCTITCADTTLAGIDCTNAGCPWGVPVALDSSPPVCIVTSFVAPASGTVDLAAGTTDDLRVPASSTTFVTAKVYAGRSCPVCVDDLAQGAPLSGSPTSPRTGVCNGGVRAGRACTTQNPDGLTADCAPGGTEGGTTCEPGGNCQDAFGNAVGNFGTIAVDIASLRTATASRTAVDGVFCPGQTSPGCFGGQLTATVGATCRGIFADGLPFGDLRDGASHAGILAAVYCIPATGSGVIDLVSRLPAPGEETLPAELRYTPP